MSGSTVALKNDYSPNPNSEKEKTVTIDTTKSPTLTVQVHETPKTGPSEVVVIDPDYSESNSEISGVPDLDDRTTMIRHPTPKRLALNEEIRQKYDHKETEKFIEWDRTRSLSTTNNKLEHIANVSMDYHKKTASLHRDLGIKNIENGVPILSEEDIQKSDRLNAKISSLTLLDERKSNVRSHTAPIHLLKRTSTQIEFARHLEEALMDNKLQKTKSNKSQKSVKFLDDLPENEYEHKVNKKAADVILRSTTDSIRLRSNSEDENGKKPKRKKGKMKKSHTSMDIKGKLELNLNDDSSEYLEPQPNSISHRDKEIKIMNQAKNRQKNRFFDKFGKRKKFGNNAMDKKQRKNKSKYGLSLKSTNEFATAFRSSMLSPSTLLKPVTMELFNQFEEDHENTQIVSMDTFQINDSCDIDEAMLNTAEPTMKWQSNSNVFHYTLTDNDFKSMLHKSYTPHSTRRGMKMTFLDSEFETEIIREDQQTESYDVGTPLNKMVSPNTKSLNDIKLDRSVTGIGSDGKMVLSDVARFRQGQSAPTTKFKKECDGNEVDQKDDEKVNDDVGGVPRKKSHHRTKKTIFGRLLEAVPVDERRDLSITIHSDFSLVVAEKPKHFRAETAKLAFTLKPVHNMKILM